MQEKANTKTFLNLEDFEKGKLKISLTIGIIVFVGILSDLLSNFNKYTTFQVAIDLVSIAIVVSAGFMYFYKPYKNYRIYSAVYLYTVLVNILITHWIVYRGLDTHEQEEYFLRDAVTVICIVMVSGFMIGRKHIWITVGSVLALGFYYVITGGTHFIVDNIPLLVISAIGVGLVSQFIIKNIDAFILSLKNMNDLLNIEREELKKRNSEILDSIKYAKRIQKAVLPDENYLKNKINNDFFVIFQPKDIVSGDFFLVERRRNYLLIAVADCTGHGVPGAFMSMLGITFLNEIISRESVHSAGAVLNELRNYIIQSLQQKGVIGEQKDGMDISFVVINDETNELQFAGANSPIYIVSKNEQIEDTTEIIPKAVSGDVFFTEVKGDSMPVSINTTMEPFSNKVLHLAKNDTIYLMSDGFEDQFGGPKQKKFLAKNLKNLIYQNCHKPLTIQKDIFINTFENWRSGYERIHEQTDDITFLGIKI